MSNRIAYKFNHDGKDPHEIVKHFFNGIRPFNFVKVINYLADGVGYGLDYVICSFPESVEQGEEAFDGVEFALFEDAVVIDYKTFYHYVKLACEAFLRDYEAYAEYFKDPNKSKDEKDLKKMLAKIRKRYNIEEE